MKKIIIPLLASLIFYGNLQAQFSCLPYDDSSACEDGHGISTNLDNLVNDNCPELVNDLDWKLQQTNTGTIANMQAIQQQKIEDLTLYIIQQQKQIDQLLKTVTELKK